MYQVLMGVLALVAIAGQVCVLSHMLNRTKKPLTPGKDPSMKLLEQYREIRWTRFFDMSSTGKSKFWWDVLIIEHPYEQAVHIFKKEFENNPINVTEHNGLVMEDYFITEHETLEEAKDGLDTQAICVIRKKTGGSSCL